MSVVCPACGAESRDTEFCDACNADLAMPQEALVPARCPIHEAGLELPPEHRALLARGDQALLVQAEGKTWRVRWLAPTVYAQRRPALERRLALTLPPLARCRRVEEAGGAWLLAESAGPWQPPWLVRADDPLEDLARLTTFARQLADGLSSLHEAGLVWLNFDPSQIEPAVNQRGLCFANLDEQVFSKKEIPDDLRVHPAYAAPEIVRGHADQVGKRTDVFHLALSCYYWLAGLLPTGIPGQGLNAFGHDIPPLRIYAPRVLPGVQGVLARGMGIDRRERYPTPTALCEALEEVLDRARRRWSFNGPVCWEVGAHTRTGRSKTALQRGNEDQIIVKPLTDPDRVLAGVADGISTCDVGSGALASLIATILLENEFSNPTREVDFLAQIGPLCRRAAQTLLDWALEKGYADLLVQGLDLMGTTLTVGWLEGRHASIANLGDSRAYLLDDRGAEQLTVDGDLGSCMLAEGSPPEEVHELGGVSKALRQCIGGCTLSSEGQAVVLEDSCRPALSRWPLLPGDVLILCTDGLVEEGAFLEPDQLFDLVRQHQQLSAADLAIVLADAADNLQRLPSDLEPEGYGDNISCVVIRVK